MAGGKKPGLAAAVFAVAAALSCWNPIAAPFGLLVGLGAAYLAWRAWRRGGRRIVAAAALAVSTVAVAWSGAVLARTAGVGREPNEAVVSGATGDQAARILDEEEERTRAARDRARGELGKVGGDLTPPARKDGQAPR